MDISAILYSLYKNYIKGNMQIGNIHWKQIRLETFFQIGNNRFRLETKKEHWKQSLGIGCNKLRLETQKLDWKQNKYIGNNLFRLETFTNWKQISSQSDKFYF